MQYVFLLALRVYMCFFDQITISCPINPTLTPTLVHAQAWLVRPFAARIRQTEKCEERYTNRHVFVTLAGTMCGTRGLARLLPDIVANQHLLFCYSQRTAT